MYVQHSQWGKKPNNSATHLLGLLVGCPFCICQPGNLSSGEDWWRRRNELGQLGLVFAPLALANLSVGGRLPRWKEAVAVQLNGRRGYAGVDSAGYCI